MGGEMVKVAKGRKSLDPFLMASIHSVWSCDRWALVLAEMVLAVALLHKPHK